MREDYGKPKIGDKFWCVETGNLARGGGGDQYEVTVVKVGRKYFQVGYGEGLYTRACEFSY